MNKPNVGTEGHIDHGKKVKVLVTGASLAPSRDIIVAIINQHDHYELISPLDFQPNSGPKKKRGKGNRWHR